LTGVLVKNLIFSDQEPTPCIYKFFSGYSPFGPGLNNKERPQSKRGAVNFSRAYRKHFNITPPKAPGPDQGVDVVKRMGAAA